MRKILLQTSLLLVALFMSSLAVRGQEEGHTITYVVSKGVPVLVNIGNPDDNKIAESGKTKIAKDADLIIAAPLKPGQEVEEATLGGVALAGADGVYTAKMPDADVILVIRLKLNFDPASAVPVEGETNGSGSIYACDVIIDGGEPKLDVNTLIPLPMAVERGNWAGVYFVWAEGGELQEVIRKVESPKGNTEKTLKPADLEAVKKDGKIIAYTDKYGFEAAGAETALKYKAIFKEFGYVVNVTSEGADVVIKRGEDVVEAGKTKVAKDAELTITVTPKEGKEIEKVTFDGKELTQADGKYKATMPEKDVVLEVKTKAKENKPGTAVQDLYFANVVVAPNPFDNQLRIANEGLQNATYTLLNAEGVVISSGALVDGETVLNTNELSAGLYLVRITVASGEAKTYRVIKK